MRGTAKSLCPLCEGVERLRAYASPVAKSQFLDIVRDHGELHLRVVTVLDLGANRLVVITSEPFDKELVGKIAADMGEITLLTSTSRRKPESELHESGPQATASANPETKRRGIVIRERDRRLLPTLTSESSP